MKLMMGLQCWIPQHFCVVSAILLSFYSIAEGDGCPKSSSRITHTEEYNGFCYQFVNEEKYWTDAQEYCLKDSGRLVMLPDSTTNDVITGVLSSLSSWKNKGVWIGLNDKGRELDWKWASNSPGDNIPLESGDWTNWGKGHPEATFHTMRDCVRMVRNDNWKWHETPCSTWNWKYKFICQYELSPPIVLVPEHHHQPAPTHRTSSSTRHPVVRYSTNAEPGEVETDLVTRQTDGVITDRVTNAEHSMAAAATNDNRRIQMWVISSACIGTVAFILIILVMVAMKRRHTKRADNNSDFCNNPMYDDSEVKPKPNRRVENVYQESGPVPSEKQVQKNSVQNAENDYLKPSSLPAITDLYLTIEATDTAGKVAGDALSGEEKQNTFLYGYEVPVSEHIYAEIPEKVDKN